MAGTARILLVDDEAGFRQQLGVGLTQRGFDVDCAEKGLVAVERLQSARQTGAPHDYVVLNMRLPDVDGRRLMEVVNMTCPEVGLIAVSAFGDEYDTDVIRRFEGCAFLDKPFEVDELVSAMQQLGPRNGREVASHRRSERAGVQVESAYVLATVSPQVRLGDTLEALLHADGVCYCDRVRGAWDLVTLVQGADGAEIRHVVEDRIAGHEGILRCQALPIAQPFLSQPLTSFIQDYERMLAARPGRNGLPQPRRHLPLSAYALLQTGDGAAPSLYPRLYFNPDVVYCDFTSGPFGAVVLLQASTAESLQRAVSGIEKEDGVRQATVLTVL